MTTGPQLFRVNDQSQESHRVEEVDFASLGLRERRDIQEWVAANPEILGDDLLIIGKEFSGFDRTNERLDLLAVDADGRLVIVELKRDDTGTNTHWQAIKYASYLSDASREDIVGMLSRHADISQDEATQRLIQHLGADDLNALNNDQRIILASHRFAPEVTSAVLWLNEKIPGDELITCVQLTPHHDAESKSLYVQVNTIIPVPGTADLSIGISEAQDGIRSRRSSFGEALTRTFSRNRNDRITAFLSSVADVVMEELSGVDKPDKRSRWAGQSGDHRYYHLWYSRPPWGNWTTSYRVNLYKGDSPPWRAIVHLSTDNTELLKNLQNQNLIASVSLQSEELSESFSNEIAGTLKMKVESITPVVDEFENEANEESA